MRRAPACPLVGGLAARHGSIAPPVHVVRGPIRDLETIARENAIEGCTRETYAALIAYRQARAAANPAIRAAMVSIARDETRHAALAWAVDAWANTRLDAAARRRVREARHDAAKTLLTEISTGLSPHARDQAGLPGDDEAARLAASLRAALPS